MADPQSTPEPDDLDFSTTLTGQPITIDGVRYRIKHPDCFSLKDNGEIEIERIRIWKLLTMDRSDSQELALDALLRVFLVRVTDAPADAIAKLFPQQLVQVYMAFTSLRFGSRAMAEAMTEVMRALSDAIPVPGNTSSLDSVGSMAAPPTPGGPTPLSL